MAHIVIIGAGIGGLPMAYEMRDIARSEDRITVIFEGCEIPFRTVEPWVAVNWRQRAEIEVDPAESSPRRKSISSPPVKRVHPGENARTG